jgi:Fur family ferric uptake transcriptional regulator
VTTNRTTRQKAAILDLLRDTREFRSAQHLHRALADQGQSISLATVYRALQSMSEEGLVDVFRVAGKEAAYRLCQTREHHHHLVCRNCGRTEEIQGPDVETWAATVGAENGFTAIDHWLEVAGLCPTCTAAADN